jgi:hypothetical protein
MKKLLLIAIVATTLVSCATTHSCHDTFHPRHNGSYNPRGMDR